VIFAALLALATIVPLPFPQYQTVAIVTSEENEERNPFGAGGNLVAASDGQSGNAGGWTVAWKDGVKIALPGIPKPKDSYTLPPFLALGAVSPAGELYVERGLYFEGAYSGTNYDLYRLHAGAWLPVDTSACRIAEGIAHLYNIESDGSLDVTFESDDLVNPDEVFAGDSAPIAVRLSRAGCARLGRFDLRDANGTFAAGYRGYYSDGKLGATNVNRPAEKFFAVRWHDGKVSELGPGIAFAILADGTAVGRGAAHATLWDPAGDATDLTPDAKASTAYAIDEAHRVIGSLTASDGRHYAFLWENGRLRLLDDTLAAPGWRLEAAFRFLPDGSIVGAGTHQAVASGFILRNV
jgi:hypothetical protein